MAEISKITLPNGDTYDIKDAVARKNADHGNARIFSADCSTAAATQRKDVTITECTELIAGDVFVITFTNYQNYNGAPTMQINSLGAKNIRRITGTNAGRYEWANGETIIFVWNGTYFLILNGGFATTTVYGRTKLYTGAGSSSTTLALNPASLYNMANSSICPYYSTSATYAVGDKVRYGDYIYECITAIPTAEAWTVAHWQIAPTLQEQVTSLDSNISKVDSNVNVTYDILSDALACTATTFFCGIGSNYLGTVPSDYYKFGTFMVNVRSVNRYVIAHAEDDSFAVNVYNGSKWSGWRELIALTDITLSSSTRVSLPFTAPHAGILRVYLRAQAQGRVYAIFNSGEMLDGYQEAGAYVVDGIPIQKGKTLTINSQSNVTDIFCDWYEFNF